MSDRLEGLAALKAVGMPPAFAEKVMEICAQLGGAFAFRAGAPFQLYDTRCAPKPGFIKLKSSNWGLMKGVIVVDPQFARKTPEGGRVEANLEEERKHWKEWPNWQEWYQSENKEEKLTSVIPIQHKVPLSQIITGINVGEYEIVKPIPGIAEDQQSKYLCVRPTKGHAPNDSKALFIVDMSKRESSILKTQQQRMSISGTAAIEAKFECPSWWQQEKWGKFTGGDERVLAFVKESPSADIKPLEIYGIPTEKKDEVLPITGDMDLLWIAKPTSLVLQENKDISRLPAEADQVLNTFKSKGRVEMLEALIKIFGLIGKGERQISDQMIGRMGIMTPRESIMTTLVNERFFKIAPHIKYLFQHGAENRSPFRGLVDINGPMLHIFEGKIVLTKNEKDLVDFVLEDESYYMKKHYFDVHPSWNHEVWSPVVIRQFQLKQEIPIEVFTKYERNIVNHVLTTPNYMSEHRFQVNPSWNMEVWAPVVKLQLQLKQDVPSEVYRRYMIHTMLKQGVSLENINTMLASGKLREKINDEKKEEKIDSKIEENKDSLRIFYPKDDTTLDLVKWNEFEPKCLQSMAELAQELKWNFDKDKKTIVISDEKKSIVIRLDKGFLASESDDKDAMRAMLIIAEKVHFPSEEQILWGRTNGIKERLVKLAHRPKDELSRSFKL